MARRAAAAPARAPAPAGAAPRAPARRRAGRPAAARAAAPAGVRAAAPAFRGSQAVEQRLSASGPRRIANPTRALVAFRPGNPPWAVLGSAPDLALWGRCRARLRRFGGSRRAATGLAEAPDLPLRGLACGWRDARANRALRGGRDRRRRGGDRIAAPGRAGPPLRLVRHRLGLRVRIGPGALRGRQRLRLRLVEFVAERLELLLRQRARLAGDHRAARLAAADLRDELDQMRSFGVGRAQQIVRRVDELVRGRPARVAVGLDRPTDQLAHALGELVAHGVQPPTALSAQRLHPDVVDEPVVHRSTEHQLETDQGQREQIAAPILRLTVEALGRHIPERVFAQLAALVFQEADQVDLRQAVGQHLHVAVAAHHDPPRVQAPVRRDPVPTLGVLGLFKGLRDEVHQLETGANAAHPALIRQLAHQLGHRPRRPRREDERALLRDEVDELGEGGVRRPFVERDDRSERLVHRLVVAVFGVQHDRRVLHPLVGIELHEIRAGSHDALSGRGHPAECGAHHDSPPTTPDPPPMVYVSRGGARRIKS